MMISSLLLRIILGPINGKMYPPQTERHVSKRNGARSPFLIGQLSTRRVTNYIGQCTFFSTEVGKLGCCGVDFFVVGAVYVMCMMGMSVMRIKIMLLTYLYPLIPAYKQTLKVITVQMVCIYVIRKNFFPF